MSKRIPLTQDKFAIIDDEDYEKLNEYKWYTFKNKNTYYAVRNIGSGEANKKSTIYMHREILKAKKGETIDHINHDGLDNRQDNLRFCSVLENNRNTRKRKTFRGKKTSSKYKGITWYKKYNKWLAQIMLNKKQLHLGYYTEEIDAAKAYDESAIKHFGEFAKLNFPTKRN